MTNHRITDHTNNDSDMTTEDFSPVLQDSEPSEPISHLDLSASKTNGNGTAAGFKDNLDDPHQALA
jgi:hypothetical protein